MRFLIALQLAFGIYLPSTASAALKLDQPMQTQLASEIALTQLFAMAKDVKTGADLVKLLPKDMNARDLRWAKTATKGLKKPITFERLNRGVAMNYDGKRHVVLIMDVFNPRLRIDGKADFSYQAANSLQVQLEVLSRALERETAMISIGLPEAHAFWPVVAGALIGGVVGTSLSTVIGFGTAKIQDWWCPGRSKADSYFVATNCEKYFDWADKNNKPSDRVPNKEDGKPAGLSAPPIAPAVVFTDCENSKFTSSIEGDSASEIAVVYKEKKADKITVVQTLMKPTPRTARFVIELDDKSELKNFLLSDTKELLGTNDSSVTNKMTPTQLKANQEQVEKGSKLVTTAITFLDFCKKKGEQTLQTNAAHAPDVIAGATPTPAAVAPIVPTVSPTSTK